MSRVPSSCCSISTYTNTEFCTLEVETNAASSITFIVMCVSRDNVASMLTVPVLYLHFEPESLSPLYLSRPKNKLHLDHENGTAIIISENKIIDNIRRFCVSCVSGTLADCDVVSYMYISNVVVV